ncbi:hypothetical protein U2A404290004 [Corynebacterium striatum]|nr:hypothetical protein U2A404290004 [Corynebacterium striatum]
MELSGTTFNYFERFGEFDSPTVQVEDNEF